MLLRMGVAVEVCYVSETGRMAKQKKGRKKRGGGGRNNQDVQQVVSDSDMEFVSESDDEVDGKSPESPRSWMRVDAEPRGKKRFSDEDELPVFASVSSVRSPQKSKIVHRAEVVIVTPSKKRRTGSLSP
jgi:hypothetical protein